MGDIKRRKAEHLKWALDPGSQAIGRLFEGYDLPYRALPEMDLGEVDATTELFDKKLNQPLIIASMTGGSEAGLTINRNLAVAARECGVAMGVGSQRVALVHKEAREQFEVVRKVAPKAVVFANMGAVQLNYGYGPERYKEVVEMVQADGLYLHLNPLQEALQPRGDTNFEGLAEKIGRVVESVGVPVFVKEVGHGLDGESCKLLVKAGVAGLDVAGVGGTSWAWIEAKRANDEVLAGWFKEFGVPTEAAVREVREFREFGEFGRRGVKLVVSGGVRSSVDGLKVRTFGIDYYSAAWPFLTAALRGEKEVVKLVSAWGRGLRIAMFVCGIKSWDEAARMRLRKTDL